MNTLMKYVAKNTVKSALLYLGSVIVIASALYAVAYKDVNFMDGLWWSFVTLTTVGYGDISPDGVGMRLVAVWVMASGIATVAVLTAKLASKLAVAELMHHDDVEGIDDDFCKLTRNLEDAVGQTHYLRERFKMDEEADDALLEINDKIQSWINFNGAGVPPSLLKMLADLDGAATNARKNDA